MLIPQFTLRWLLGATAVCAVVFSVVGLAVRGYAWAAGISVAIGALVVAMLVFAMLFAIVWAFSLVAGALRRGGDSPFATGSTPFRKESGPPTEKDAPATPILLE